MSVRAAIAFLMFCAVSFLFFPFSTCFLPFLATLSFSSLSRLLFCNHYNHQQLTVTRAPSCASLRWAGRCRARTPMGQTSRAPAQRCAWSLPSVQRFSETKPLQILQRTTHIIALLQQTTGALRCVAALNDGLQLRHMHRATDAVGWLENYWLRLFGCNRRWRCRQKPIDWGSSFCLSRRRCPRCRSYCWQKN